MEASMEAMGDRPNPDPRDEPESREVLGMDDAPVEQVKAALADMARLTEYAADLADAVEAALPVFVERAVRSRLPQGAALDDDAVARQIEQAARQAHAELMPQIRTLLMTDIDEQRTNPLAILRAGVRFPTEVLRALGVQPLPRDADAARLFPDDDYDLTPGSFADVDPSLHEPGLLWGAAKAHVHLSRRRDRSGG
jgi:hypothetical protein